MNRPIRGGLVCATFLGLCLAICQSLPSQEQAPEQAQEKPPGKAKTKAAKKEAPFRWINKLPVERTRLLAHGTFHSAANRADVGYFIYLPPGYTTVENREKHYPVVYYLRGGRAEQHRHGEVFRRRHARRPRARPIRRCTSSLRLASKISIMPRIWRGPSI